MNATLESTGAALASGVISRQAIDDWARGLVAAGHTVIAPQSTGAGASEYRILTAANPRPDALGAGLPRMSPKGAYFPRSEVILRVRREGKQWTINDPADGFPSIVVLGARPCDAAAPEILAPLFGWDFQDRFFQERVKKIAFVVVACGGPVDSACFCTSVGIDPAGQGSGDVVLTPLPSGDFHLQARTPKGQELLEKGTGTDCAQHPAGPSGNRFLSPSADDLHAIRERARSAVAPRFTTDSVRAALEKKFDDPMWKESAQSCLACGTCAYACPTCHCFDIQDEMTGKEGRRQKNWDACQFPLFTLHTSGHNPRHDQPSRWRQRLNHKFRYYPDKFGKTLCTGCGRCIRLCPGGMDLLADLSALGKEGSGFGVQGSATSDSQSAILTSNQQPATSNSSNIYRPYLMRVADLRDETPDVRTLRLEFADPAEGEKFRFEVGQFGLYNALGEGESTFCIASSPTRKGYIECTFRQAGRVTRALRRLGVGDLMGFRGPYGNRFPTEQWKGKDILFVAGGIALPPMRCVIQYCLDNRADYGDITIVYGARTSTDLVYKHELAEWDDLRDVRLWQCIDWKPAPDGKGLAEAPAEDGWIPLNMKDPSATPLDPRYSRYTGFVPQMVEAAKPSPDNRIAVVCGPPIMIKFTLQSLKKLGFSSEQVYTTLENRMKCGLGKCGRCNVGGTYVCKEGPVFTAAQVEQMPASEM